MGHTQYVTIVSQEGFEYMLPLEACYVSPVLKKSVNPSGGFRENREGVVRLEEMSAVVVEVVVQYLLYWYRYRDKEDVPDMEFPVELCVELLEVADYLQMDSEHMPQSAVKMP